VDQIEYVDKLLATAPKGKFHNPAGFYVRFIQDNGPVPQTFVSSRKQRLRQEEEQTADMERARNAHLQVAYDEYRNAMAEQYITNMPAEDYNRMFREARQRFRRMYSSMTEEQISDVAATSIRGERAMIQSGPNRSSRGARARSRQARKSW
jgi:hypothetical protein